MAVQKLHDACKAAFISSSPPPALALQKVRLILDSIKAADVGLDEHAVEQQERGFGLFGMNGRRGRHSMSVRWAPPISYLHLYECDEFSMGVFCLPTSASIPLHNHPGMTVLSKVLYGSMHVKAFDWVNPYEERLKGGVSSKFRVAKLVADKITTFPCETAVLHPTAGGNIHAFTALAPCAVLDVLAPPYSTSSGRHCTYYREFRSGDFPTDMIKDQEVNENEQGHSWLEEFQPPDDFVVHRGIYRGPRVLP